MSSTLFRLLHRLDEAKIHYFLARNRPDTIDITVTVVGQRVEISVFEDGHVEVSRFLGNEDVLDEAVLDDIIEEEIKSNRRGR